MVTLNIDGREIQAEEGTNVLQAATDNNIYVPSMCYAEAVIPYGDCRLCTVEITTAGGQKKLTASCMHPVEEGLKVITTSEKIDSNRKKLMELMLARCPDSEVVQEMARSLGVTETPFEKQEGNNKCILCTLCVRTCQEVVGVSAISLVKQGADGQECAPFIRGIPKNCIGCGSCAYVCPTHAITVEESEGRRTISWPHNQMKLKLKKCNVCGDYWTPERQLEHIAKISGTSLDDYDVCPACRE
ncbi:2Fe-2S iron-sulfur cluster-binding protein [Chloroflexota bacterium]